MKVISNEISHSDKGLSPFQKIIKAQKERYDEWFHAVTTRGNSDDEKAENLDHSERLQDSKEDYS